MRVPVFVIGFLAFGTILVPGIAPADCVDYGSYLHVVGGVPVSVFTLSVAVSGRFAYAISLSASFQTIDISDPRNPRIVATLGLPTAAFAVAVSNSHAYVADDGAGLQVIDISDPSNPRIVGSVRTAGCAHAVAVSGSYAYVTENNGGFAGLEVIDISNPLSPRVRGQLPEPSWWTMGVAISGNYAYMTEYSTGLWVVDITDPWKPRLAGNVVTPGNAFRVAVSGVYAYVAASSTLLVVVDISVPRHPRVVGTVGSGNHASECVAVSDHYAYVGDLIGDLNVIDVTDPANPMIDSVLPGIGYGTAVSGRYAYVNTADELYVIDILNHRRPGLGMVVPVLGAPVGVAVSGNYAYVANQGAGLAVVKVDPDGSMTSGVVGSVDTGGLAFDVAVEGRYAYVANSWLGLQVVDVAIPDHPQVVAGVDLPGPATRLAVSDSLAYIASGDAGLQIVDISNPAGPRIAGSVITPGFSASAVAVSGHRAFVIGTNAIDGGEFQVVDVSDPSNPLMVGELDSASPMGSVSVSESHAYVTDAQSEFFTIDIANSSTPRVVGVLQTPGYCLDGTSGFTHCGMSVAGGYAYVTALGAGLLLIDISDPQGPRIAGTMDSPAATWDVTVEGKYVYIAEDTCLQILPIQCQSVGAVSFPGVVGSSRLYTFPSPSLGRTTIHFRLPAQGRVLASIHDVLGRQVREVQDGVLDAGEHDLRWDGRDDAGRDVAAGVYLARVSTAAGTKTARVVVLR